MLKPIPPELVKERFSEREQKLIGSNSIERVINTSVRLVELLNSRGRPDIADRGDTHVNLEDWDELKEITVKLWNLARNDIFAANSEGR